MTLNILLKISSSYLTRVPLANAAIMKGSQAVRMFSVSTLIALQRAFHVQAVSCTTITPLQRFTHVLGVTERGHCAFQRRMISTEPPEKEPEDPTTVNIAELKKMIADKNVLLIDVREPYELQETGKIENAVNIPLREVPEAFALSPKEFRLKYEIKKPNKKDENIVFHCKAGIRSNAALQAVYHIGYRKSRQFPGGYDEWETS